MGMKLKPDDPVAEWNLTPQVVDDLGDVHKAITECRTEFSMLKSVNRDIKMRDLSNISEMLGLVEQIADMTFMYIAVTIRENFYAEHDKLSKELYSYFNIGDTQIQIRFFDEITKHMRQFYTNCMKSGLWIKTGRVGTTPTDIFFGD